MSRGRPGVVPSEPRYRRLASQLREDLLAGRLRPGDRLPSEPELAARNGVARMTARRAIEDLVNDGLLVRHRGRGTFVAEPRVPYPPATVLSFTRTMAALGHAISTKLLDLELVPASSQVAQDLGLPEGGTVLLVRRLRFMEDEPVALHESYMAPSYLDGLLASDLLTKPISEAMENVTGDRVAASRDYLEAAAASRDEAALLGIGMGDPVQLVVGVAYADSGRAVLVTRAVYRADRFRFVVSARAGDVPFEIKAPEDTRISPHSSPSSGPRERRIVDPRAGTPAVVAE